MVYVEITEPFWPFRNWYCQPGPAIQPTGVELAGVTGFAVYPVFSWPECPPVASRLPGLTFAGTTEYVGQMYLVIVTVSGTFATTMVPAPVFVLFGVPVHPPLALL